jgi:hypothetical protein
MWDLSGHHAIGDFYAHSSYGQFGTFRTANGGIGRQVK